MSPFCVVVWRWHRRCRIGAGLKTKLSGLVRQEQENDGGIAMLSTVLIVVLVLALIGALPTWPYSSGWGYYPSGGLGLVVLIVLVLLLTGRL
jgi:Protein of unknown function (DUF3309)